MTLWRYAATGLIFAAVYLALKAQPGEPFGAATVNGLFDPILLFPLIMCVLTAVAVGRFVEWRRRRSERRQAPASPTS